MQKLNLPEYDLKLREEDGRVFVFDPFRSKYLLMTPEEEVRQHFARYLMEEKSYPASLMATEYSLRYNKMSRRCDIIIFNKAGNAVALVECKAPEIKISQEVFDQVARYNLAFKVKYLMVTNGLKHYCCEIDFETGDVKFLAQIPDYSDISQ